MSSNQMRCDERTPTVRNAKPARTGRPYAAAALFGLMLAGPAGAADLDFHTEAASDNPILWYQFNESAGDALNYGSLGPGFDAAAFGTPIRAVATPRGDAGVEFDGSDDFFESLQDSPASLIGNPVFTAEAVVFVPLDTTVEGWPPFLHWGDGADQPGGRTGREAFFGLAENDDYAYFAGFYGGGRRTFTSPPQPATMPGFWKHVVWVRDGGTAATGSTIYVNSIALYTLPDSGMCCNNLTPDLTSAAFRVNRGRDLTRFFEGIIDEVVLYDYALTEEDVRRHFKALKFGEQYTWNPVEDGGAKPNLLCDVDQWDIAPWTGPYDRVVIPSETPSEERPEGINCESPRMAELIIEPGSRLHGHTSGGLRMYGDVLHNDGSILIHVDYGDGLIVTFEEDEDNVVNPAITGTGIMRLWGEGQEGISFQWSAFAPVLKTLTHGAGHTINGNFRYYGRNTINEGTIGSIWSLGSRVGAPFHSLQFFGASIVQTSTGLIWAEGRIDEDPNLPPGAALITLEDYQDVHCMISGGTIRTNENAMVLVEDDATLESLTIDGLISVPGGEPKTLTCRGDMTNLGEVYLHGNSGSGVVLLIDGAATWTGTGRITLDATNNFATRVNINPSEPNEVLTNGPGHTIAGNGQINVRMDNRGVIAADADARYDLYLTHPRLTNDGTLLAGNGAELRLDAVAVTQSAAGVIRGDGAESTVWLMDGTSVVGGALGGHNEGEVLLEDGVMIDSITIDGTVRMAGGTVVSRGDVVNNGTLLHRAPFSNSTLHFDGSATWSGSGELILSAVANPLAVLAASDPADVLTNAADHAIRGWGAIECRLDNRGLVSAGQVPPDSGTKSLFLRGFDKLNHGTIESTGDDRLRIDAITIEQGPGGAIRARDDADVWLENAATIRGGALAVEDNSEFWIRSDGTVFDGVSISGPISMLAGTENTELRGVVTNNGELAVPSGVVSSNVVSSLTRTGPVTVTGTGRIVLNGRATLSRLTYGTLATDIFTNAGDHRIEGRGSLFGLIVNDGVLAPGSDYYGVDDPTRRFRLVDGGVTCGGSSRIEIQVEGTDLSVNSTEFDHIEGEPGTTFHCAGELILENINGFGGLAASEFLDIIVAPGGVTGTFERITFRGGAAYRLEYLPDRVRLHRALAGDTDGDGDVDIVDLNELLSRFGASGPGLPGDVDGDGDVDLTDLAILLSNFGA